MHTEFDFVFVIHIPQYVVGLNTTYLSITESIREQKPEDFDENGMPVWRVGDTEENSQVLNNVKCANLIKSRKTHTTISL